jgi:hypothetical protein
VLNHLALSNQFFFVVNLGSSFESSAPFQVFSIGPGCDSLVPSNELDITEIMNSGKYLGSIFSGKTS